MSRAALLNSTPAEAGLHVAPVSAEAAAWTVEPCTDREAIARHFEALPPRDRWMRFGHAAGPEAIRAYVQGLDLRRDLALAARGSDGTLAGLVHLARDPERNSAELAISVLPAWRRQGIGGALVREAVRRARALRLERVWVYFRRANRPMASLAFRAGFSHTGSAGDSEFAELRLREGNGAAASRPRHPSFGSGFAPSGSGVRSTLRVIETST